MTKDQIILALAELNKELKKQNVHGEICIMGGAVMCLVFNSRESTQDIDAIMAPTEIIQKAAFNVSQTLNLENNFWINDAVKVFESDYSQFLDSKFSYSHLNVLTASPEYMFAMKSLAARSGTNDEDDLIFLKNYLKLTKLDQAMRIINKFYPEQKLNISSQALLKDLFNSKI
ncbi:MAG: hypothetical protein H7328_01110 [Bdellovibrio sp.]|nr:hypothetical protein [Bdellovibrio sp.]